MDCFSALAYLLIKFPFRFQRTAATPQAEAQAPVPPSRLPSSARAGIGITSSAPVAKPQTFITGTPEVSLDWRSSSGMGGQGGRTEHIRKEKHPEEIREDFGIYWLVLDAAASGLTTTLHMTAGFLDHMAIENALYDNECTPQHNVPRIPIWGVHDA
ncbi:hypothetical protein DOTSEDRAFT_29456 [Dothistroma septosporum NZE10]|uniref:Uncharacterized protein n=1 Tax=Dothistroma septosporum (strain NZE10 / CBS 128990) TaxID=675120 RepID=N1PC88_DOTSN|nr:hypothetical protein DOTSEDRAFT_29456 [Dothistroma septosporum NZE10]